MLANLAGRWEPADTVLSNRNRQHLILDSYRYRFAHEWSNGNRSYRCVVRTCSAREIILSSGQRIARQDPVHHNHPPPTVGNLLNGVRRSFIREGASNTNASTRVVIQNATYGLPLEAAGSVQSDEAAARTVQRTRQRLNPRPPEPASLAAIPVVNITTAMNEPFCYYDSGAHDPKRFMIFTCASNLERLASVRHMAMDGTFKVTPPQFFQTFVLHAVLPARNQNRSPTLPMVYVFMADKSYESYVKVFQHLPLNPSSCIADFEQASRLAFTTVYGNGLIYSCFFHLMQSLLRKIQHSGLITVYREDNRVKLQLKILCTLAYVPVVDVQRIFLRLLRNFTANQPNFGNHYHSIRSIYEYFWETYVRDGALFPPAEWNQCERVQQRLPRSDAALEGWHHGIKRSWGIHSPFWKIMDHLLIEQHHVEVKWEQFQIGRPIQRQSAAKWRRLTRQLENLISTYPGHNSHETFRYLTTVAHLFELE